MKPGVRGNASTGALWVTMGYGLWAMDLLQAEMATQGREIPKMTAWPEGVLEREGSRFEMTGRVQVLLFETGAGKFGALSRTCVRKYIGLLK